MPRKPDAKPADTNLLLVEDVKRERHDLEAGLRKQGFNVTAVPDGQKAIDLLVRGDPQFDLLILNLIMPGMDGLQTLGRLTELGMIESLPIIMTGKQHETESLLRCIEIGADDYVRKPIDPQLMRIRIQAALARYYVEESGRIYVRQIEKEKRLTDDLLNVVIPIGVALSAEKDFNHLLEMILLEAKRLCNADGGTLYLRTEDDLLKFMVVRNDTLELEMGGVAGKTLDFPPLRLYEAGTGAPNHRNVATHVALTGETFNVADAYSQEDEFDFSGTMEFDTRSSYHSTSFLNVPLKNAAKRVIGVLQLINAKDLDTGGIVAFHPSLQQVIESLAALAAVALEAYQREAGLRQQIEQLRIEIDEVRRKAQVAEVTQSDQFKELKLRAKALREEALKTD